MPTNPKYAVTVDFDINIRSIPQMSGKIIGLAKKGNRYEIIDTSNSFWIKIKFGENKEGWVVKKYFKIVD